MINRVRAVCNLLIHSDPREQKKGDRVLRKIVAKAKEAVPALVEVLDGASVELRLQVAGVLLRDLLSPGFEYTRASAICDPVDANLWNEWPNRASAGYSFDLRKEFPSAATALPVLCSGLRHCDDLTQAHAAICLGQCGSVAFAALPSLVLLLKDEYYFAAQCAAEACHRILPALSEPMPVVANALRLESWLRLQC